MKAVDVDSMPGLGDLVAEAEGAGEVLLVRYGRPIAKIVLIHRLPVIPRRPGSARGLIHMADDFDAPMEFTGLA